MYQGMLFFAGNQSVTEAKIQTLKTWGLKYEKF